MIVSGFGEPERAALDAAIADFESSIRAVPDGSADEMLRDSMRRVIEAAHRHEAFLERLVTDPALNNSSAVMTMGTRLLEPANGLLARIKATGELRPISDLIIARTLVSLFMGIIASDRAMPSIARVAMRLFPERAWIDGMVDILIYGLLEDDKR